MKQGLFKKLSGPLFVILCLPISLAMAQTSSSELIIIGSGVSGLRAAEYLKSQGFSNFIILEGRNRIGGRTYTYPAPNFVSRGRGLDLGASWVHGAGPYNPLTRIVKKIHVPYKISELNNATLYNEAGHEVSTREQLRGNQLYKRFVNYLNLQQWGANRGLSVSDAVAAFIKKEHLSIDRQAQLLYRVSAFIEQEYAADITRLSQKYFDSDDSFRGPEWMLTGGYSQFVNYLARDLKNHIILNQKVRSIDYSRPNQVLVTTQKGKVYSARTVLNTLPIGVMQQGAVQFIPALPLDKKIAMTHINMGIQNKIWLEFPKVFWDDSEFLERQVRAYLSEDEWINKGRYIEFVNMHFYTGKPHLMMMVSGDFAKKIEHESDAQILSEVMPILRKIYGNSIPQPTAHLITRWGQDPFAYGSYSSLAPGAIHHGTDYSIMAKPIGRQVFFAGEATHKYYPGTVHGAYLSGEREAKRFLHQNPGTVRDVNNAVTGFTYFKSNDLTTWGAQNYGFDLFPTYSNFRRRNDFGLPIMFGYGVNNNMDISASLVTYHREREIGDRSHAGVGDLTLGTRYVFYNVFNTMTDFGINFTTSFPTGNLEKGLTDGFIHYTPTLLLGHNAFYPVWDTQIFAELGIDETSRQKHHFNRSLDRPAFSSLIFNAGAAAMNDFVLLSIEYNLFNSAVWDRLGTNDSYITPGFKLFINKQMTIGLGAPIGLTQTAARYQLLAELVYQFAPPS